VPVGETVDYTQQGLQSGTSYQFRLMSYRGTPNVDAVFGGFSNVVSVTTAGSPPPPPPPPSQGSHFRAHEPPGMTPLTNRPFSKLDEGWDVEFDGDPESIASDAGAPLSPPSVLQLTYPSGFAGGGPGGNVGSYWFGRGYRTIYVYVAWKIDDNWYGHESGTNKQFFIGTEAATSSAGNNTFFSAQAIGHGRVSLRVSGQDHCCGVPYLAYDANGGDGTLWRGRWTSLEFVLTANTPGVRDGRLEVWVDGAKTHDHVDFGPLREGEGPGFDRFLWSSIWGGVGGTVPEAQHIWVDHIYVSGKE
jgi:hypothetical protein